VKTVLSANIDTPRLNDVGDSINKPGRRVNGYDQHEFLEAFFGKDQTRRLQTATLDDPLYVPQKTLKEQYPLSDFLKKPALLEKEEQINKLGKVPDPEKFPHFLPKDNDLAYFLMNRRQENQVLGQITQEQSRDPDNPTNGRVGYKVVDLAEQVQKEFKRQVDYNKKKSADLPQGYSKMNLNYLGDRVAMLEKALQSGKFKGGVNKHWFDALKSG